MGEKVEFSVEIV